MQSSLSSLVSIYLQDEDTLKGRTTSVSLTNVTDGPKDDYCAITQGLECYSQNGKDFICPPDFELFGSINAFGVCSSVLRMYHSTIQELSWDPVFKKYLSKWTFRTKPLIIFPYHDKLLENAFYRNNELHFYSFEKKSNTGKLYHTSHSFDIVAHETGHAVLDRLRPDLSLTNLHTRALHETFGDCAALFAILDNPDLRHALLSETKGDLRNKSFLPVIAEAFGKELGKENGLRNAQILTSMEAVGDTNNSHYLSEVFTGAIYDCLADEFKDRRKEKKHSEDKILDILGKDLRTIIMKAFLKATSKCSYGEMANLILDNCLSIRISESFNRAFEKRGVLNAWDIQDIEPNQKSSICGTFA